MQIQFDMPMVPSNSLFMRLGEVRRQTRRLIVESDTNLVVLMWLAVVVSIATLSETTEMAGRHITTNGMWAEVTHAKRRCADLPLSFGLPLILTQFHLIHFPHSVISSSVMTRRISCGSTSAKRTPGSFDNRPSQSPQIKGNTTIIYS